MVLEGVVRPRRSHFFSNNLFLSWESLFMKDLVSSTFLDGSNFKSLVHHPPKYAPARYHDVRHASLMGDKFVIERASQVPVYVTTSYFITKQNNTPCYN